MLSAERRHAGNESKGKGMARHWKGWGWTELKKQKSSEISQVNTPNRHKKRKEKRREKFWILFTPILFSDLSSSFPFPVQYFHSHSCLLCRIASSLTVLFLLLTEGSTWNILFPFFSFFLYCYRAMFHSLFKFECTSVPKTVQISTQSISSIVSSN